MLPFSDKVAIAVICDSMHFKQLWTFWTKERSGAIDIDDMTIKSPGIDITDVFVWFNEIH